MGVFDRARTKLALAILGGREKSNRAWPVMLSENFGQKELSPIEDFQQYAEIYRVNPWSYAATYAIASAASGIPWGLYRRTNDGEREKETKHWISDLLLRPNPRLPLSRILFSTFGYLELAGNAFWALETERSSTPNEIWPLRPDRVVTIPDREDMIAGYRYKVGIESVDYEPEEIIHFDYWNPVDESYGQGSITAARNAHTSDLYASEWNKRVFRKGTHGTAAIIKEEMTKPQIDRIKEMIRQNLVGDQNYGNVEVLWGVDFKQIGMTAKDAEFLGLKKQDMLEILAAHGVPPALVGVLEYANYANMREQLRIFWQNLTPKLVGVRDTLNVQLVRRIDPRLELDFDLSGVEALQEDRNQKAARHTSLLMNGLRTRNEIRAEDGLDPVDDSEGDTYYLPMSAIPVGSESSAPPAPDDGDEETRSIGKRLRRVHKVSLSVLDRLPSAKAEAQIVEKRTRPLRIKAAVSGASQIVDAVRGAERSLGKADDPTSDAPYDIMADPKAIEHLRKEGARKAKFVTEHMRDMIRTDLGSGIEDGLSLLDLGGLVDSSIEDLMRGKYWALRIARTEVRQAQNFGSNEAMVALEIDKKVWISAGDENTRELHLATDSASHDEPVSVGDAFQPINAEYPGASGLPEEDINCRCDSAPFVEGLSGKTLKDWEGAFVKARDNSVARLEAEWVAPLHKYLNEYAARVKAAIGA
jgi:HK97 family phage portal protein